MSLDKEDVVGTALVAQWLRLRALNAGGLGLILGQGTGSPMLQLRPGAVRHINKIKGFFKKKKEEEDAVHISCNISRKKEL